MCGIAGLVDTRIAETELLDSLQKMVALLTHRGPDSGNSVVENGVGLGHRRLAIIDLSDNAKQPMKSACGRYIICFNGEIYNYREIRSKLQNERFRSSSDVEVLLEAIAAWGIEKTLEKLRGMFAFALFDRQDHQIFLARDHFGQKPLFFVHENHRLAFASELRAFKYLPGLQLDYDEQALAAYFRYNCIGARRSIFKQIRKVTGGSVYSFKIANDQVIRQPDRKFWSLDKAWENRQRFTGSFIDARQQLNDLLSQVVKEQMRSDVPIGCFLSGGTDSTLLAGLMKQHADFELPTFTVAFSDKNYDESAVARFYASQLRTRHHEILADENEMLQMVRLSAVAYDEPFADTSQLPTLLLCRQARRQVKVCLSGDGADEIFGGYYRHLLIPAMLRMKQGIFGPALAVMADVVKGLPLIKLERLGKMFEKTGLILPRHGAQKLHKMACAFSQNDLAAMHEDLMNNWKTDDLPFPKNCQRIPASASPSRQSMLIDLETYLPDDILPKVDRAAMHFGLETRMPYLDLRVVDFAFSLPDEFFFHKGAQKRILRELRDSIYVENLSPGGKTGFSPSLPAMLRGSLRSWAEDRLASPLLSDLGFGRQTIFKRWHEFLRGQADWSFSLWALVQFVNWHEHFRRENSIISNERSAN
ncbi:MAG: asparagine synthase (glutamine-hydrolyzing) [Candidatus Rifleibacteriota bacterium]